jgi:hypothetical protein
MHTRTHAKREISAEVHVGHVYVAFTMSESARIPWLTSRIRKQQPTYDACSGCMAAECARSGCELQSRGDLIRHRHARQVSACPGERRPSGPQGLTQPIMRFIGTSRAHPAHHADFRIRISQARIHLGTAKHRH